MDFKIGGETGNAVLQTIHASEGGRALRLMKEREKLRKKLDEEKSKIEQKNSFKKRKNLQFGGSAADRLEEEFKKETIGLVSADVFREKRQKIQEQLLKDSKSLFPTRIQEKKSIELCVEKTKLSFGFEDDADRDEDDGNDDNFDDIGSKSKTQLTSKNNDIGDEKTNTMRTDSNADHLSSQEIQKNESDGQHSPECEKHKLAADTDTNAQVVFRKRRIGKDPTVDTHFLPDEYRDVQIEQEKQKWINEYNEIQETRKKEILAITYSYWDGTGHRRKLYISQGSKIGDFLDQAQKDLSKDFPELKNVAPEHLMYIKEDLILPHEVSFHELIRDKARGKSGPLFHFDVHDDIRLYNDSRVEKDESHAGKIVERKWYERNKHIFPASRWEIYNPNKTWDKYTIHGHEVKCATDKSSWNPVL